MAIKPRLRDWKEVDTGEMCTVSADAIIFRHTQEGDIEVLTGRRGLGRWEAGKWMLTFGGMVEKNQDNSAEAAVRRELNEEVPGMEIRFIQVFPLITGPVKYAHYWDPERQEAVNTGQQVQDIPIITINFVVECVGGEPRTTAEVPEIQWVRLAKLTSTRATYAFDHARAISHLLANRAQLK